MITVSLPGISIPVKSENYDQLISAYDKYRDAPGDAVLRFKVENAYWRCYKKKASAELVDKLAKLEWGSFRAWDVFGKSSPALLQYDYTADKINENWGFRHPRIWIAFSFISQPILYFCSVALLFMGSLLAWVLASTLAQISVNELIQNPVDLVRLFILFAFSPSACAIGAGGMYAWFLSTRSGAVDSHVYVLKRLLDEQQLE